MLPSLQAGIADERDRALARELSSGTARWYFQLAALLEMLADRPVKDVAVRSVLLCGLYQLRHTRVPPHAAISESVNTVRKLGRARAAGLVNAVLRRYQRETDSCERQLASSPVSLYAYPKWMIDAFAADWPDDFESLLAAGNERAPMWLRVNRRRGTTASWSALLNEQTGMDVQGIPFVDSAVCPASPVPVHRLPGFEEGLVSVQDAGAQLATPLMTLQAGMRVLDACAAPGGKACHMLESADISLTCVDRDAARLERIEENLQRLDLSARIVHGDAADPATWWDGTRYDRILLDVPCSATGVVRRHPDIKLLRRADDVVTLAAQQLAMLRAVWPLLAPGGRLLYSTCSTLKAENAGVVETFLAEDATAGARALEAQWGRNSGPGRQILTGEAGMDGFYYSCLEATDMARTPQ
ncbi:MAG: 16S rRNA (cytosine(967)-C(5))-methyltransferase RsmB [Gammaproteobacteria bacterium]|nr:16S rRNA (cytosine(967)-C(5))-methyltransferase RsmB [Gammaproteobacteria bacterium]